MIDYIINIQPDKSEILKVKISLWSFAKFTEMELDFKMAFSISF
jgi:hypothetical protein